MRNRKILFFLLLTCYIAVISAHAGVIQGKAFYENNVPAANVTIEVIGMPATMTNKDGSYSLNLKPGTY